MHSQLKNDYIMQNIFKKSIVYFVVYKPANPFKTFWNFFIKTSFWIYLNQTLSEEVFFQQAKVFLHWRLKGKILLRDKDYKVKDKCNKTFG